MDTESQWIFDRMRLYRLWQAHPDWSLRQFGHTLGYDKSWVRKWLNRFQTATEKTWRMFVSQSRAPHHCPHRISEEVKQVIGDLRDELSETFHRRAGGRTILHELLKRDDLRQQGYIVPQSASTITRILKELGYIHPKVKRPHQLLDLPPPMDEWEMDFAEIRLAHDTILEFVIVVDRGTSRLVYLEGSEGYHAETALEAIARLFILKGLPKRLRFDRDTRFVASWTSDSYPSALVRFLLVIGVEPIVCPPRRPDLKPVVERTIKTLKYEWLARHATDNIADALAILEQFPHYYNHTRPHQGQACQNQPPDIAFPALPTRPNLPDTLNPDPWLEDRHGYGYRRRVTSNGTIMIDKHVYYIGQAHAKHQVIVHVDAHQQQFFVTCDGELIKQLDILGLYHQAMDFQSYLIAMKAEARSIERHRLTMWYRVGDVA